MRGLLQGSDDQKQSIASLSIGTPVRVCRPVRLFARLMMTTQNRKCIGTVGTIIGVELRKHTRKPLYNVYIKTDDHSILGPFFADELEDAK